MIDEMHKNGIRVILDGVRSYIKVPSFLSYDIYYLGIQSF
jgi:1,4-alpha-glucan branching enzyme